MDPILQYYHKLLSQILSQLLSQLRSQLPKSWNHHFSDRWRYARVDTIPCRHSKSGHYRHLKLKCWHYRRVEPIAACSSWRHRRVETIVFCERGHYRRMETVVFCERWQNRKVEAIPSCERGRYRRVGALALETIPCRES